MAHPSLSGNSCMDKTCAEVCHEYVQHARRVYRRSDGTPTRQANNIATALREVETEYGDGIADRFHSSHLKAIRSSWVAAGLTRSTINARTRLVVACFAFANEMGWIPDEVVAHLRTVRPLSRGYAVEGGGVEGISPEKVAATIPFLQPAIADMMKIMLLTGCRVGEAREARSDEYHTLGNIAVFRPKWHKTVRHGCSRSIVLPKEAVKIVEPRLGRKYLFGPGDGEKPYHRDVIGVAVQRACKKAGIERWSPGQIRHTAATTVFERHGLEATRALLGHTSDRITRTYVHANDEKQVAGVVGTLGSMLEVVA